MGGRAETRGGLDSARGVEIGMGAWVRVLEPVTVETGAYKPYLSMVGFEQRRLHSTGHFLDTADVRKSGAVHFEEVFRMVPGVKLRPNGSSLVVELQRGEGNPQSANYCPP